jgi:inhibitor of cysteine peptidase
MKTRFSILIVFILAGLLMTACSVPVNPTQDLPVEPTQTPSIEPTRAVLDGDYIAGHQGKITSLEILILESFPVQVQVQVSGYLMNGCVELVDVTAEQEEDTFVLTLNTRRPAGDVMCTEALVPFDTAVSLDVYGLPAGSYSVVAGDQQAEFNLDMDNAPQ